jgi:hypothetical protein
MKSIFYSIAFFFFALLLLMPGISADAQTYTMNFPSSAPTDYSAGGPVDQNDANGQGIETGVKFYVTQPGTITGIRYLRSTFNSAPHIGHIWDNLGNLLLTSAALPESGNGWQEGAVSLHINANTIYVASVFNPVGDYAATANQFSGGTDYGTAPIKIVATAADPQGVGNGVYIYTNSAAFPNGSNSAPNYWIDIRFQPDFSLPVSLSDLKAVANNSDVAVSWKTISETNNKGFEIQRSNNGSDWYAVSFVNGAGESTIIKNYYYTDKGLAPGLYYYRLKQTDLDGKFKNSSVVTATVSGKGQVSLYQNYPNPFRKETTIRYDLPTAQKVRLSVIDMNGREVKVLANKLGETGSHLVTVDASGLSRQIYFVRLQTASGILVRKILVE